MDLESFNTKTLKRQRFMDLFYGVTGRSLMTFAVAALLIAGLTFGAIKSTENHTLLVADFSKSVDGNNFARITGGAWTVEDHAFVLKDPATLTNVGDDGGANNTIVGNANVAVDNMPLPDQNWTLTTRARGTDVGHPFQGFSVIFGYTDLRNYYFANFNNASTATTNGIFQVKAGVETKLVSFTTKIKMDRYYDIVLHRVGQTVTVIEDGQQVANVLVPGLSGGQVGFGTISNGMSVVRLEVVSSSVVPSPPPPPSNPVPGPNPSYSCDSLTAQQISNSQTYAFSVNTSVKNGASVDSYIYNFGDNTSLVTSNQNTVTHTYATTGNMTASVEVKFKVNGQIVAVNSQSCLVGVSVSQPVSVPTSNPNPPSSSPPLPSSGVSLDSFFAPAFIGTSFCHFSNQNASIANGVLTISYPAGSSAPSAGAPFGGAQTCIPSSTGPLKSMQLTYSLRFPVGFQFVKGGKLPGLYGGVEPFSGGSHNANGWSARLMWRANGAGEIYSYTTNTTGFGDEYGLGNFNFQTDDQWHTVAERITLNNPGVSNGIETLWYDGRQVINQTGINITATNTPVTGLFFSTFYGGHDSTWAPTANTHIDFQNFSVSQ